MRGSGRKRRAIRRVGAIVRGVRRRRDPEVARQELLDAAERVFADVSPEQAGLKVVAREAGVSHALITHYFGTYTGLVEATLERRIRALRAQSLQTVQSAPPSTLASALLDVLFDALADPVHVRLIKWVIASDRPGAHHAMALQERGLQIAARQLASAVMPGAPPAAIEMLELAMATAIAAAYGYALARFPIAGSLGREPSAALDRGIRATLARMLQVYLEGELAPYRKA